MPEFSSENIKEEIADEELKEKEPTSQELAEACREVLDEETCIEIAAIEFEEALAFSFTCLIEAGIDDPEEFLIKKGILEKPQE